MKAGQFSYVEYLPIKGYNADDAEYYGFSASKGHWIVVDEDMNELAASDAPVVLDKESSTGNTKFKAVRAGKCSLKYVIDENVYPTRAGASTYTKNSEITTAVLAVTVDDGITYEITGDYTGVVNAPPESLEGDDKLQAGVFDADDLEIDREYIWQKREKDSRGIKLTSDGIVSFTKPGTFHVRIKDKNEKLYSDWKEIKAEVYGDDTSGIGSGNDYDDEEEIPATEYAEEGTIFVISGKYTGGVSNDTESIEGSGKLSVAAYEDSGQEQNVLYSWEARDDSDGMTLTEDGHVSFTRTGSYYVRVKSGPVYSEWVEIHANQKAPASLTRIPTPTGNTYTGESVDILAADVVCEGGTAVYALGTDDTTEPTAYSSDMPTAVSAGKYYVWCKVLGDENHDNSEPVCIVAEIVSASDGSDASGDTSGDDGGNTSGEDTPASSTVGSSGSGCNAGFSVLGLGMMAAVIIGRKTR